MPGQPGTSALFGVVGCIQATLSAEGHDLVLAERESIAMSYRTYRMALVPSRGQGFPTQALATFDSQG
jgi:hypothetical protein